MATFRRAALAISGSDSSTDIVQVYKPGSVLFELAGQRAPHRLTGAREAGNDRSNGNAHDTRQFPVGQALELAPHEQLTKPNGQMAHGFLDEGDLVGLEDERLGIAVRVS